MSLNKTLLVLLIGAAVFCNGHQKKVNLDEDEDEPSYNKIETPSAPTMIKATSVQMHELRFKFENDLKWKTRGQLKVSKDASGKILNVEV